MKESEKIKEKIRTIKPEVSDELLDLLYEYIFAKFGEHLEEKFNKD